MATTRIMPLHVGKSRTESRAIRQNKAGYSKKFRDEHEQEILLHQAAKKAHAEYRHSRGEMREILTAKANVDRLLKMEVGHPHIFFNFLLTLIHADFIITNVINNTCYGWREKYACNKKNNKGSDYRSCN